MKLTHVLAATAIALAASQAHAIVTFSSVAATAGNYSAITGLTGTFTTQSADTAFSTRPLFDLGTYSVITTGSPTPTATLTFGAGVTSYTFLWGSPDALNSLFVDAVSGPDATFTGNDAFAGANGNNANTRLFTVSSTTGLSSLTFSTGQIAFEVAQVSAIPEPQTYALLLAGLGAVGFVARRRKSI